MTNPSPAEQFFYTNAAYTLSPATETTEESRLRAAHDLAAAEQTAAHQGWGLVFSVDEPSGTAFAILEDADGNPLATLPDIPLDASEDADFRRTATAQLALDVLQAPASPES